MIQNLKGYALGQPPLVVFTVCLVIFGVTIISLAYIIKDSDVPNPDVTMDWNIFLENLAGLDMCIKSQQGKKMKIPAHALPSQLQPNSSTLLSTQNGSLISSRTVDRSKSMSALLPDIMGTSIVGSKEKHATNVTVSIRVPLKIGNISNLWQRTKLQGYVKGSFLGFTGKAGEQHVNVSLIIPMPENTRKHKTRPGNDITTADVCLTFKGSSLLLPMAKRPPSCSQHIDNSWQVVSVIMQPGLHVPNGYCNPESRILLGYSPNPNLTVMLSHMDRSLANLHLMHTSYFLFIVAASFICFSLIRSCYYQNPKHGSPEKIVVQE